MGDNPNGRQRKWKTTKKKGQPNGRQPKWKMMGIFLLSCSAASSASYLLCFSTTAGCHLASILHFTWWGNHWLLGNSNIRMTMLCSENKIIITILFTNYQFLYLSFQSRPDFHKHPLLPSSSSSAHLIISLVTSAFPSTSFKIYLDWILAMKNSVLT